MTRWSRRSLVLLVMLLSLAGWLLSRSSIVQALIAPQPVFSPICAGPGLQPDRAASPAPSTVALAQPDCALRP